MTHKHTLHHNIYHHLVDLVERLRVKNKLEQLGQTQPVLSTDLREEFSTSTSTSTSTLTLTLTSTLTQLLSILVALARTNHPELIFVRFFWQRNVFRKHHFMYFLSNLRTFCIISFTDSVNLGTYCEN